MLGDSAAWWSVFVLSLPLAALCGSCLGSCSRSERSQLVRPAKQPPESPARNSRWDYPRRMNRILVRFACLASLMVMTGCGEAEIGEDCDESGSLDECVEGAICTNEGEDAVCRALCSEHDDCPSGQLCNGVSGSNQKSCQPS